MNQAQALKTLKDNGFKFLCRGELYRQSPYLMAPDGSYFKMELPFDLTPFMNAPLKLLETPRGSTYEYQL